MLNTEKRVFYIMSGKGVYIFFSVSGLVFENLNDSTVDLPPHIRYKIRQNATFNPTTKEVRNKLWFPSPGSYYLKYYYFGFVWIQVN